MENTAKYLELIIERFIDEVGQLEIYWEDKRIKRIDNRDNDLIIDIGTEEPIELTYREFLNFLDMGTIWYKY